MSLPRLEFAIGSMRVVQVVFAIIAVAAGLGVGAGFANDARTVLGFGQMFLIMLAAGGVFLAGTLNLARLRRQENTILDRMADERILAAKAAAAAEQRPVRPPTDAVAAPPGEPSPTRQTAHPVGIDHSAPTEPFEPTAVPEGAPSRIPDPTPSATRVALTPRRSEALSTPRSADAPKVPNPSPSAPETTASGREGLTGPPPGRRVMHPNPPAQPDERHEKPARAERRVVATRRVAGRPRH